MIEVWKDIAGYEGRYKISSYGNVLGVKRGHILKPRIVCGYAYVHFSSRGRNMAVHRLVAEAFIPNPNNLPHVNHRDEDKLNNHVDNLEWCSAQYNKEYSAGIGVVQLRNGVIVAEYASSCAASRCTGINRSHIYEACRGWVNKAGGYEWKFANEFKQVI